MLPLSVSAGTTEGLSWLSGQQNASGSFGATSASLATEVQTTAEVLRSYQALGQTSAPVFASALTYLNGTTDTNTEFLSREIAVNAKAGNDVSTLITTLLANQNTDGGFGNGPGEGSSVFDTAYALEALAAANYNSGTFVAKALGYLLNKQTSSGGYADGVNDPSVFTTAQAMRSLLSYRTTYQGVSTALTKAQTFLLSKRDTSGAFGDAFETALALTALVPIVSDQTTVEQSVIALRAQQGVNGAWSNDAYTTALALQALALSANPPSNPAFGTIQGRVTDASTGVALSGVSIALTGTASQGTSSGTDGSFRFSNLTPGAYGVNISLSGYAPVGTQTSVAAGQTLDLGTIALVKSTGTTTGVVRGRITANGAGIAGVSVTLVGPVTITVTADADGNFEANNLPPGTYTVVFSISGYGTVSREVVADAGQSIDLGAIELSAGAPVLPDLAIMSVDGAGVNNNPETLSSSGTLNVTAINLGNAEAPSGYEVLAFYDVNHNGVLDDGDAVLGRGKATLALAIGATELIPIPVSGTAPFRDAPVRVWVDSTQLVEEYSEDNNIASTIPACETPPIGVPGITVPPGYNVEIFASAVTVQQGPIQLWLDRADNLYVATGSSSTIIKIPASSHTPQLFGSNHYDPDGVVTDSKNNVIVADGHTRKYDPNGGLLWDVTCPANTQLAAIDALDDIYVGTLSAFICKISSDGTVVNKFTGFSQPSEPVIGPDGYLYVSDLGMHSLYKVDPNTGTILSTVVSGVTIASPTFDSQGNIYYSASSTSVYKLSLPSKQISTFATGFGSVRTVLFDRRGNLFVGDIITKNVYRIYPRMLSVDLTAGMLRINPGNVGGSATLTVRVGNAGSAGSIAGAVVRFYEGNPANGGRVLGDVIPAALGSGEYTDVTLDNVTGLSGTADIYAVVDATNRVSECVETNNTAQATPAYSLHGSITVGTDSNNYNANATAVLSATVTNTGSFPGTFNAELRIEDAQGVVVSEVIAPIALGPLTGGGNVSLSGTWNTANTLAGPYTLRGVLYSTSGEQISEATTGFTIIASPTTPGSTVSASLRVSTDRPVYFTTDTVSIQSLVGNATINAILDGLALTIRVIDPAGQVVFTHSGAVGQLPPGSLRDLLLPYAMQNAEIATYRVEGELRDAAGNLMATATTQFAVQQDLGKALKGKVEVAATSLYVGTAQVCTDTVTNTGNIPVAGLELHHVLVNVDTQELVSDVTGNVDIAASASNVQARSLATGNLSAGHYACLVQARVGTDLKTLAYTPFVLTVPPIKFDATLKASTKPRILVLLDDPTRCAEQDDVDSSQDKDQGNDGDKDKGSDNNCGCNSNTDTHKFNALTTGTGTTVSPACTGGHGNPKPCTKDLDPFGPKDAPRLSVQRAFLENLLQSAGYAYTITESAEAFTREFHSGRYTLYLLFTEHEKLSEKVQKELREAAFRGEGLVVADSHDARHHFLSDALGIKLIGEVSDAYNAELTQSELNLTGSLTVLDGDKALRIERTSAQSVARFRLGGHRSLSGGTHEPDCCDLGKRYQDRTNGIDVEHRDEPDACHGHRDRFLDAATINTYGQGKTAFAAFDLLASATRDGQASTGAKALLALIGWVNPATLPSVALTVQPLELTVTNRGIATTATAAVTLPNGAAILDKGDGQITASGLSFTAGLAVGETRTFTFWVALPPTEGAATFSATVSAGNPPAVYGTADYTVNVEVPTLGAIKTQLESLVAQRPKDRHALKQVLHHVEAAYRNFHPDKAITELLKATDALLNIDDPAVTTIRTAIDEWIRYAGALVR